MHLAMVGQHDHMLAIRLDRIFACRIDHDRPVMAHLLLQTRMAMIPIGARLDDRKLIDEGRFWFYDGEVDSRYAIYLERYHKHVPVARTERQSVWLGKRG